MKAILRAPGLCDRAESWPPHPDPASASPLPGCMGEWGAKEWGGNPPCDPTYLCPNNWGAFSPSLPQFLTHACSAPPSKPYQGIHSTKGWLPMQYITSPPLTISYKLNSQLAISTFQWKLISPFQCKRPQRQCLKGITENLILCLAAQNSIKIFLHTVCQKPHSLAYTTESKKSFSKT